VLLRLVVLALALLLLLLLLEATRGGQEGPLPLPRLLLTVQHS
jgi:hypothetical protein